MSIVLAIHNMLRWLVLISAAFALFRMIRGMAAKASWSKTDRTAGLIFTIMLDLQLMVGLMLYFIFSPLVKSFFSNLNIAMQDPGLRYWGIEHILMMVIAVVVGHIGSSMAKKDLQDRQKFSRSLALFSLALILLLLGIPWFRPLLPF